MDPLDFYNLGKQLRSYTCSFPEALKRTIVGRIYYAIFLMVRDELGASLKGSYVEALYDSVSQKGVIHSLVIEALSKTDPNLHLRGILSGMRRQRDAADYRIRTTKNWDREINDIISMADTILQSKSLLKPSFDQEIGDIELLVLEWHSKIASKP